MSSPRQSRLRATGHHRQDRDGSAPNREERNHGRQNQVAQSGRRTLKMDLSRKDFIGGALSGAAVLAAPGALANAKGEKMDNGMNKVEPSEFVARTFAQFDKGWFLLTGGDFAAKWNTMTVSWGFAGTMWGKPVVAVVVRPTRYTREFLDARAEFTLSAFPEKYRKALTICGTKSGRDCDKMALTGLTPVASEMVKPPTFKEANLVLECRTLYRQPMTEASFIDRSPFEKWYSSADDLHIMYIAEVLAVRQAKV